MPRTRPSKVPFIRDILYDTPHFFYGLTETWLLDQKEAETKITGYQMISVNRKMKRRTGVRDGGGVAIYINDADIINHEVILEYSFGGIEAIGVRIKTKNIVVILVYRQPDNPGLNQ